MDWMAYFCSAVVDLQIQPSEAWFLSLQEFWALADYKFGAKPKVPRMTKEEGDALIAKLTAEGKL